MSRNWHQGGLPPKILLCKLCIPYSVIERGLAEEIGEEAARRIQTWPPLEKIGEVFVDELPDFVKNSTGDYLIYHAPDRTAVVIEVYQ